VLTFVLHRGFGLLVSTLLVITITFLLMQMIPGDPAAVMLGANATPEQIELLRESWGLNEPIYVQFGHYLANFLRGNFGESLFHHKPVLGIIAQRAEASIWLSAAALLVVVGLGIPSGVLAAIRPNGLTDNTMLLVMTLFAGRLGWLPSSGFTSILDTGDFTNLKSLILPAFSLGFVNAALVARTTRSSMLDVLHSDYITTARAKGLCEWVVIMKHAFRNASIPIVTVISFTFASLVSGAVVTENVFALPGIGSLIVQSVLKRDYPVIQGIMFTVAVLYVLVNFVTDLSYAMLDPRIRYR